MKNKMRKKMRKKIQTSIQNNPTNKDQQIIMLQMKIKINQDKKVN